MKLYWQSCKKITYIVRERENEFVNVVLKKSLEKQCSEIKQAKKSLSQSEHRIADLDWLFTLLYENNVLRKLTDERF